MKKETAAQEPQKHRKATVPLEITIPGEEQTLPAQIEQLTMDITPVTTEDRLLQLERHSKEILKGGIYVAGWTIRIGGPLAAGGGILYGTYLGVTAIATALAAVLPVVLAAIKTLVLATIITGGSAYLVWVTVTTIIRNHRRRVPFDQASRGRRPGQDTTIEINNHVEVGPGQGGKIKINNFIKQQP